MKPLKKGDYSNPYSDPSHLRKHLFNYHLIDSPFCEHEECLNVVNVSETTGQRPIIIVPIDSHGNLPQNQTHSYASQLMVDPNTFSRREIAPGRVQVQQNRVLASIQGRYFSRFRDTQKSLNNDYSKTLHSQLAKTAV